MQRNYFRNLQNLIDYYLHYFRYSWIFYVKYFKINNHYLTRRSVWYTLISYWIDLKTIYCWSSLPPSTVLLRPTTEPSLSRTSRSNWAKSTKRLALDLKCKLIWLDLYLRRSRKTDRVVSRQVWRWHLLHLLLGGLLFPDAQLISFKFMS